MSIQAKFNDIAEEYDKNRRNFIPCFDDYYGNSTRFIASNIKTPKRILDLGAGTGLLSHFWFQHFPSSEYVLVDIADEMLKVARKRFSDRKNVFFEISDYSDKLPNGNFDVVVSALSIHHLEHEDKSRLFEQIYDKLPDGGLFVNYDQFCAGQSEMDQWFDRYWESQLADSGLTEYDIGQWQERRKLDRECSVEQEMDMFYKCGFNAVKCIYSYQKFSVIVAIK